MKQGIAILGIFVADLAFRAGRQPVMGETLMGSGFKMGPGGKGSNQAVAAARAGGSVSFISRLGQDAFGDIAIATWTSEGIAPHVAIAPDEPTGAAYIFVSDETGENAIIVVPGAAGGLSPKDVEAARSAIAGSKVFVTQLEQPIDAARRGLEIARAADLEVRLDARRGQPLHVLLHELGPGFVVHFGVGFVIVVPHRRALGIVFGDQFQPN